MSYGLNDLLPGVVGRIRGAGVSLNRPNLGRSLLVRRTWFAEDDVSADGDPAGTDDGSGGSSNDANKSDEPELLRQLREGKISAEDAYSLITNLRSEAAAGRQAKKSLTDFQKQQEAAARKQAEEQGEYKKLWDDAQAKLKRLEELEALESTRRDELSESNEKRLKELPKDKRSIAESLLNKIGDDPYKRAAALDDLLPTLSATPPPPGLDGGSKGDGKDAKGKYVGSEEHRKAVASRYRMKN